MMHIYVYLKLILRIVLLPHTNSSYVPNELTNNIFSLHVGQKIKHKSNQKSQKQFVKSKRNRYIQNHYSILIVEYKHASYSLFDSFILEKKKEQVIFHGFKGSSGQKTYVHTLLDDTTCIIAKLINHFFPQKSSPSLETASSLYPQGKKNNIIHLYTHHPQLLGTASPSSQVLNIVNYHYMNGRQIWINISIHQYKQIS